MKTNVIATALITNADAQKLKSDLPACSTAPDPKSEEKDTCSVDSSLQTMDSKGALPAWLICALVAE